MSEKQKICFIINPIAGGKKKTKLVKYLENFIDKEKIDYRIINTDFPGHAHEIAKTELQNNTSIIVAVGGDGTINEIASAIKGSEISLGIIPFGSGNGFARHFHIPLKYRKAIELIFKGNAHYIDCAKVNGRDFFCTSGIGFDAEIGHLFASYENRGFLSYGISFFKAFRKYKCQKYELVADGIQQSEEAFLITIANISQYGNHFYIAPDASASDGFLDLVILNKFPKWKVPILIFRSFFETIDHSIYVDHKRVKTVSLKTTEAKHSIHIDGEPETLNGELKYEIEKKLLKIISKCYE